MSSFESIVGSTHIIVECGSQSVLAFVPAGQPLVHVMSKTSLAGERPRFEAFLLALELPDDCTDARSVVELVTSAVSARSVRVGALARSRPEASSHAAW